MNWQYITTVLNLPRNLRWKVRLYHILTRAYQHSILPHSKTEQKNLRIYPGTQGMLSLRRQSKTDAVHVRKAARHCR
jgi:hypothetical protein